MTTTKRNDSAPEWMPEHLGESTLAHFDDEEARGDDGGEEPGEGG